jgi:hypothetical protein
MAMRQMAAVVRALLRLQPFTPTHCSIDSQQVQPPVVGMRSWSDVVRPVELSVHHHCHLIAQPSTTGDDVGHAPSRWAAVECHPHRVEWDLGRRRMSVRRAAACARQIATGDSHVADRLSTEAMPNDPIAKVAIGRHDAQIGRAHSNLSPRVTLTYRHHFARSSQQPVARLRPPPRSMRRRLRGTTDRPPGRRNGVFHAPVQPVPTAEARR